MEQVEALRAVLRGEQMVPLAERFEIIASKTHGDIDAVLLAMRRLGVRKLLSARPCREADLVMAMVAARIVAPRSEERRGGSGRARRGSGRDGSRHGDRT